MKLDDDKLATVFCQTPKPIYPREWADAGERGVVKILLVVSASEGVVDAKVEKSSGFSRLDAVALASAKTVRCEVKGDASPVQRFAVSMPMTFDFQ
ncbi:TonB family protein [Pandoraea eparura]|uniref:TonB family protein n=1 Tax=Pandoraea eparura TaxID=2508291 RepID=UPI001583E7AC|nr:TonB family protein [Pandoraea eparura]